MPNGRNNPGQASGSGPGRGAGGPDKCVCPNCGHEELHQRGTPCSKKSCPECGTRMVGKW